MPADEYSGDIARSLRRVARSSIDQLVATRLEALAADHKLRASGFAHECRECEQDCLVASTSFPNSRSGHVRPSRQLFLPGDQ